MKIVSMNHKTDDKKTFMKVRLSMGLVDGYTYDAIDGFAERLLQLMPGLALSPRAEVGQKGISIAQIVARVALELQTLSGMPQSSWQVEDTGIAGTYDLLFGCRNEEIGEYAARAAFRIVRSALYRQRYSLAPDLRMLQLMNEKVQAITPVMEMSARAALAG